MLSLYPGNEIPRRCNVRNLSPAHIRARRPMLSAALAIASICFVFLAVAACSDPSGRNIRDCSQWRTESIPGCYDGQGGGDMN
jgi:hypothetical protein